MASKGSGLLDVFLAISFLLAILIQHWYIILIFVGLWLLVIIVSLVVENKKNDRKATAKKKGQDSSVSGRKADFISLKDIPNKPTASPTLEIENPKSTFKTNYYTKQSEFDASSKRLAILYNEQLQEFSGRCTYENKKLIFHVPWDCDLDNFFDIITPPEEDIKVEFVDCSGVLVASIDTITKPNREGDDVYYAYANFFQPFQQNKQYKADFVDEAFEEAFNLVKAYLLNKIYAKQFGQIDSILSDIEIQQIPVRDIITDNKEKEAFFGNILASSDYFELIKKDFLLAINDKECIVDYQLPSPDEFPAIEKCKYVQSTRTFSYTKLSKTAFDQKYERALYAICLRTIKELFSSSYDDEIETVTFNGFVNSINRAIGKEERRCIISLRASKSQIESINLKEVDPKVCFKSLKGISASKLSDVSAVVPIMKFDKNDHRFVEGKDVISNVGVGENLAMMDWEDFEHLVRNLFESIFSENGGEVKVTQASRDGGVDAVAFDPDPIRGGKIVIQAKRYTNTVPVSAVRDLYGTVINEGANRGILITTSDYGRDSYDFAQNKPITLLNGGHLLGLLQKNGIQGRIDIQEAKDYYKQK